MLAIAAGAAPVAALVDLWSITASPTTFQAGEPTTVKFTVTNKGAILDDDIGCVEVSIPGSFEVLNTGVVDTPSGKSWDDGDSGGSGSGRIAVFRADSDFGRARGRPALGRRIGHLLGPGRGRIGRLLRRGPPVPGAIGVAMVACSRGNPSRSRCPRPRRRIRRRRPAPSRHPRRHPRRRPRPPPRRSRRPARSRPDRRRRLPGPTRPRRRPPGRPPGRPGRPTPRINRHRAIARRPRRLRPPRRPRPRQGPDP